MAFDAVEICALTSWAVPLVLLILVGGATLLGRPFTERWTGSFVRFGLLMNLAMLGAAAVVMLVTGRHEIAIDLGHWFSAGDFGFEVELLLDRLSIPVAIFASAVCGVVSAFSHRYLHREPGYNRFFIGFLLLTFGIQQVILGASIELVFTGWELVGLSSALLVAFFHERRGPVENGLRVYAVYRVSDLGLVGASILLHHSLGTGRLTAALGAGTWPTSTAALSPALATALGLLILLSVAGKGAQVPFSGWLPRAMEGPTASSAIFYGALSVHAGVYLLLRFAPVLEASAIARGAVIAVGAASVLVSFLARRVATDIKSSLAWASSMHVGMMLVEIGLGLHWIALVHLLLHASVRSLQFLRTPSLLHEYHELAHREEPPLAEPTGRVRRWLYALGSDAAFLDLAIDGLVLRPLVALGQALSRLDEQWLAGSTDRSSK